MDVGSTSCSPCPSGKFSNYNPGGTACEDTATPTAAPSQSPTGSPTSSPTAAPTACLPGTHINAIGGGCTPCEAGRPAYASSSIATRTQEVSIALLIFLCSCLTGTYSAISGLAQCTACPAGSANPHPGQSSAGACVLCENGKVAAATGALPPASSLAMLV